MIETIALPKKISPYAYVGMIDNFIMPAIRIENPAMTCESICKSVGKLYNLEVEQLREKNRKRNIVKVRQIISWILRKRKLTTVEIGDYFQQDHTAVIFSTETVDNLIATDPAYKKELQWVIENYN